MAERTRNSQLDAVIPNRKQTIGTTNMTQKIAHHNARALAETGSVILRGVSVPFDTDVGQAFTTDCARNTEGLMSDRDIKTKWMLSDEDWAGLAANTPLLDAVRTERERRIISGDAAREGAQRYFAKAPIVLGDILTDEQVPPRHRIEAARELRQAAAGGDSPVGPCETFKITINLGGDEKLVYEKQVAPWEPSPSDDGEQP
jgi:hypothetical protein